MQQTTLWQRPKLFGEQGFTQEGVFRGGCGVQVQQWRGSMDKKKKRLELLKHEFLTDPLKHTNAASEQKKTNKLENRVLSY